MMMMLKDLMWMKTVEMMTESEDLNQSVPILD